jgi:putative flippase GtrA
LALARYLFVGIGSNLINFVSFYIFHAIGISLFMSSGLGYSVGLIFSYHFGRIWVFGLRYNVTKKNVIRFFFIYLIGGLGMSLLIELIDNVTGVDYRISWFFGAFFAVINNFFGLKYFVFNKNQG